MSVLEDETGQRARWLRRAGRVVFVVFLGWLLAIVLGGLGLMPIAGIPLAHALRPSLGPPPVAKLPTPRLPPAVDLRPALSAAAFARATTTTVRGKSSRAPGQTTTTSPGRSGSAPGRTKTTTIRAHGKSTASPGHTRTTTTTSRSKRP